MVFIDARIIDSRLRTENFETFLDSVRPEGASFAPQPMKVEQTTEVGSSFSVSVDDTKSPSYAAVSADFSVQLLKKDDGTKMATYTSKVDAIFRIAKSEGVTDWEDIPADSVSSMLSVVFQLAASRAESSFSAGGFKGFRIPVPNEISGGK